MNRIWKGAAMAGALATLLSAQAAGADGLISRKDFFSNPERGRVRLSPDGRTLSFTTALAGVNNVFVAPVGDPAKATPVTHDKNRGISNYFWAENSKDILYLEDDTGDENYQLHAVDVKTGKDRNLTPFAGARADLMEASVKHPDEILITLNKRDPKWPDVYKADLKTGALTMLYQNEGYAGFVADADFKLHFASLPTPDGGMQVKRFGADGKLADYLKIPSADALTTNILGFDTAGTTLYAVSSLGRDKAALVTLDPVTAKETVIGTSDKADITDAIIAPVTGKVQAYGVDYLRNDWTAIDSSIKPDLDFIAAHANGGQWEVMARSDDNATWIVHNDPTSESPYYWLYDRKKKSLSKLFTMYPQLAGKALSPMIGLAIKARDGMDLPTYLTLPPGSDKNGDGKPDNGPLPTVLFVHGGPWGRDTYGYQNYDQWLANRGYAVLNVNFRGSTGFGKAFVNAGDKQWGRTMEDDLLDAKAWAVKNGIAKEDKTAIMGGSYGGYATLAALTMHPTAFACGVDLFGPANLETLLGTIPPYWASIYEMFAQRIGDPRTDAGKALLKERSPVTYAGDIARPLLVGQGVNDARVKQAESDMIVHGMQAKKLPVTYVLFDGEGHGFAKPENNMAFNAISEAFLGKCLGGPYQPIGDDFKGSTLRVMAGADDVPGLSEALAKH